MQRSTNLLAGVLLVLLSGCAANPVSADAPAPVSPEPSPQLVARAEPADTAAPRPEAQPAATRKRVQRGRASWYAHRFHGRRTASGERYNRHGLTAAHPTLPIPSYARVRNPSNGREVIVRINDRGPFRGPHIIDLSHSAASMLGILRGSRVVEIEQVSDVERRGSSWPQERAAAPSKRQPTLTAQADPAS